MQWYEKGFDLAYGASGSGKTKALLDAAEAIHVATGKKTRWFVGDGGRATIDASGLVEDGIVEVWEYNNRPYPLTVLQQMTEGYWPEDTEDPKSLLKAPDIKVYESVGAWIFEGLYVVSEFVMGSAPGALAERASRGEKIGQDSPVNVTDPSGLKFGGNPMAHYQFAQRRIVDAIQRSKALPGYKAWTTHETTAEDKDNGNEKVIGPAGPGRAMTPKLGLWFGNFWHFTTATKAVKKRDPVTGKEATSYENERRMYTKDHGDPDGTVYIKYLANSRVATFREGGKIVNPMPEYLNPPDILKFYEVVEQAKTKARASRKVG